MFICKHTHTDTRVRKKYEPNRHTDSDIHKEQHTHINTLYIGYFFCLNVNGGVTYTSGMQFILQRHLL